MATPPTRVTGFTPAVGWASTATPKTSPTFDVQAGDLIVLIAFSENERVIPGSLTWTGSGAWTLAQSLTTVNYSTAYLYTCVVTASATGRTISMSRTGEAGQWSFYTTVWRNHGGLGVTGKANAASGAPSLSLAASANSAVVVGNSDWNAASPTGRAWRTVNGSPMVETSFGGTAGQSYMCYTGYSPDTGPAGSITVGMTAPSQKYAIVGAEILGTSSGSPALVAAPAWTSTATMPAPSVAGGVLATPATVTPSAATASAALLAPAVTGAKAATVAAPAATASAALAVPTVQGLKAVTVAPSAMAASAALLAPQVTGNRAAVVQAPALQATAASPAPLVAGSKAATVVAPVITAQADMLQPTVMTAGMAVVQAPPMGATAAVPAPTVTAQRVALVAPSAATATATVASPLVSGLRAAIVMAPAAVAAAILEPPNLSAGVTITAPIIAALGALLAPSVAAVSKPINPNGNVEAWLVPRSRVAGGLLPGTAVGLTAYLTPPRTTGRT